MTLHLLGARLTRLEHDARRVLWVADVQVSFVRLMAEASAEIGLCIGNSNAILPQHRRECTPWAPPRLGLRRPTPQPRRRASGGPAPRAYGLPAARAAGHGQDGGRVTGSRRGGGCCEGGAA
jgi:hypothetical protein